MNNTIPISILITLGCAMLFGQPFTQPETDLNPLVIASKTDGTTDDFKPRAVSVDTSRSTVVWRGTKWNRRGHHEGTMSLSDSHLYFLGDTLVGGKILVDMSHIHVTDIPPHEVNPIRELTDHLKDEFATRRYAHSLFELQQVRQTGPEQLAVSGLLTVRGVTKRVATSVRVKKQGADRQYSATLELSRSEYGIGEDGSWFAQRLVDDLFTVTLEIWVTL